MKTYLTVASHWDTPGIRQYASQDRKAAERKAAEIVDELIDMFADDFKDDIAASHGTLHAPPKVADGGGNWEATLRALQLARLIEYSGGEGEANDMLFMFGENCSRIGFDGPPPLIGEGFGAELQRWIAGFIEADDHAHCDAKIGFPMVWIEEVETMPGAPAGELALAAQAMIDEFGGDVPDWLQESVGRLGNALRAQPPVTSQPVDETATIGALSLGDVLSVIQHAKQFTDCWIEDAVVEPDNIEEHERAASAAAMCARVRAGVIALWPLLSRIDDVLDTADGAITGLDEQLEQLKRYTRPTFDDDAQLQAAVDEGTEAGHMISSARKALGALGLEPSAAPKPIRVLVGLEGGLVQGASADVAVDLIIVDYDTEGCDLERIVDVPQPDGDTSEATVCPMDAELNPAWIDQVVAASDEHDVKAARLLGELGNERNDDA